MRFCVLWGFVCVSAAMCAESSASGSSGFVLLVEAVADEAALGEVPCFLEGVEEALLPVAGSSGSGERLVVAEHGLAGSFHLCGRRRGGVGFLCEDEAGERSADGRAEDGAAEEIDDEEDDGVGQGDEEAGLDGAADVGGQGDDGSDAEEHNDDAADNDDEAADDDGAQERRHLLGGAALETLDALLAIYAGVTDEARNGLLFVVVSEHF